MFRPRRYRSVFVPNEAGLNGQKDKKVQDQPKRNCAKPFAEGYLGCCTGLNYVTLKDWGQKS